MVCVLQTLAEILSERETICHLMVRTSERSSIDVQSMVCVLQTLAEILSERETICHLMEHISERSSIDV